MNLGAFAVIAALQKRTGVTSSLGTFAGLGRREPLLGVLMTLFLLSLIGIPPTAGFFAKAEIIIAAVEAGGPLTMAGRDHRAQRRGRRLLLPAGHRLHVHARLDDRGAGPPPRRAAVGRSHGGVRAARSCSGSSRRVCSRPRGRRRRRSSRAETRAGAPLVRRRRSAASGSRPASRPGARRRDGRLPARWNSATTWSFGIPARIPRRSAATAARVVTANGALNALRGRDVASDLGDHVQEALVVARPDLHDHAQHLLAVRDLRLARGAAGTSPSERGHRCRWRDPRPAARAAVP